MTAIESTLDPILAKYRRDPTALLQILREAQEAFDWISPEIRAAVASALDIAPTRIDSLTQFYAHLYDAPRGKYRILFSDNITDRMAGSVALMERMLKRLKLERGKISADGLVSVDFDLLHRHVRPGPGPAGQQSARHPPDGAAASTKSAT